MSEAVGIARDGAVQILRFDRPEKKNALTAAMYEALSEALEVADADDAVAVSVFLGSPGVFTAGNDIGDFVRMASDGQGLGRGVLRFLRALATSRKPLVAGVDGLAVGIGTTLLLHCDYAVASRESRFRTPFVDLGLVPEAASSLIAPRLMGHARAFALLVMGQAMDAEEALAAGLVNAVAPADEVEPRALAAAQAIAEKPRAAMLAARRLLRGDPMDVLDRIEREATLFAELLGSSEAQAAFAAFMAKGR